MAPSSNLEDSVTSVALQQCLYFNVLLASVYFAFCVMNIWSKSDLVYQSTLNRALTTPMVVFWAAAEVCRIYCGYVGNLNEKVPETSAFLLVTTFPQLPALLFLTFVQEHTYPMDYFGGILMLVLTASELAIGAAAFQSLIRHQTAQFYRLVISP